MKINRTNFDKLVKQHEKDMEKREQGIAKLTQSYEEAKTNVEIAKNDLEEAKQDYDPNAMMEAKIRLNAAEEVQETLKNALDEATHAWVYDNSEIDKRVREAESFARETEESAGYALGEIIAKMIPIIEEADKIFDDANEIRRKVTRGYTAGPAGYHQIYPNGLLGAVKKDIARYMQHFPQYMKK